MTIRIPSRDAAQIPSLRRRPALAPARRGRWVRVAPDGSTAYLAQGRGFVPPAGLA